LPSQKQVEDDFIDETPVFIGVLNGSFMVVSDFMKQYTKPCEVSFIKMASYEGTSTKVKQINWFEPRFDWAFCCYSRGYR
jgi:hypoxanthine phosphoribosyltransferase